MKYKLANAEHRNEQYPSDCEIPDYVERNNVEMGHHVKLVFLADAKNSINERIWVKVVNRTRGIYYGTLANDPFELPELKFGDGVEFSPGHIFDIDTEPAK